MKYPDLKFRAMMHQLIPMEDEEWKLFISFFRERKIKRGQFILEPNKICRNASFVVSGSIKSYFISQERIIINDFYSTGDFAVEVLSFLQQSPSDCFLQANEDTVLYSISAYQLNKYCEISEVGNKVVRCVYEYFFILRKEFEISLRMVDVKERLMYYMDVEPRVFNVFNQKEIASHLNMTPETFSRTKKLLLTS